jgi:hypothetical protein
MRFVLIAALLIAPSFAAFGGELKGDAQPSGPATFPDDQPIPPGYFNEQETSPSMPTNTSRGYGGNKTLPAPCGPGFAQECIHHPPHDASRGVY